MTEAELDALEKRLSTFTQAEWGEAGMAIRMANSAIAALRRELYDAKHHAKARLVALRETETELQCAESEKDALRRELADCKLGWSMSRDEIGRSRAERDYFADIAEEEARERGAVEENYKALIGRIARVEKAESHQAKILAENSRLLNAFISAQAEARELREAVKTAHKAAVCYESAAMKQTKAGRKNMHTGAALAATVANVLWPAIMPPDCRDRESCSRHSDCMYIGCSARIDAARAEKGEEND